MMMYEQVRSKRHPREAQLTASLAYLARLHLVHECRLAVLLNT
jgi:hypothetical protein